MNPRFPIRLLVTFCLTSPLASHAALVLTDDFSVGHDYSAGNVTGTIWSGVLDAGNASTFDTTTSPGTLTIVSRDSVLTGYEPGVASSPFLYLLATGDFDATVFVSGEPGIAYSDSSLMALGQDGDFIASRAFHAGNEFTFRVLSNNATTTTGTNIADNSEGYLRLQREGNTYTSYASLDGVDWTTLATATFSGGDLTDDTVMVGLAYGTYSREEAQTNFDNFSITVPEPSVAMLIGAASISLLRRRRF